MNREESQRRLAGRITMARTRAGMRQEDLAKRVGVSSTTVKSWESGRHAVASQNYSALARAFGISVSKLLEGIEDDNFDEEEWAIDVEVAMLNPRVKERVARELFLVQSRQMASARELVGASVGRRGFFGEAQIPMAAEA